MDRRVARIRDRHKKPVQEEMPFGMKVSPRMLKMAEKYMWVFVAIALVLLVVAYFQFSPFFFRLYRKWAGTVRLVLSCRGWPSP
jgi:hypothetical protein